MSLTVGWSFHRLAPRRAVRFTVQIPEPDGNGGARMTNRRSIVLTATGLAAALVVGLALNWIPVPSARAQAPVVLKIQASWPVSLTIFDHLKLDRRPRGQALWRHAEDRAAACRDDRPRLRGPRRDEQEGHRRRPHRRLLLGGQEQDGRALHRRPRRQLRDGLRRRPRMDVRGRRARAVPAVLQGRAEAERRPAAGVPERARRRSAGSSGPSRTWPTSRA